jgi:hypothetical protein
MVLLYHNGTFLQRDWCAREVTYWWRGLDLIQRLPSHRHHKGEFLVTELWLGEAGYGARCTRSVEFEDILRLCQMLDKHR